MTPSSADHIRIGPLALLRTTRLELTALALAAIEGEGAPLGLAFCNAHTAEIALHDPAFAAALDRLVVVNDGIGLQIAARILEGRAFPDNLNGTDFLPHLFGALRRPTTVYLLGAAPGIAEEAGRRFAALYPQVRIAGVRDGYFSTGEEAAVVAGIAAVKPDMLLVAFGNPKQELFIARHFDALGARAMFGVGALLDFTAGKVVRAPEWVRRARLEWLFRLLQEPGRLVRRYTVETAGFLFEIVKLRLSAGERKSP